MRTSTGIRACKKRDSVLCLSVKNKGFYMEKTCEKYQIIVN